MGERAQSALEWSQAGLVLCGQRKMEQTAFSRPTVKEYPIRMIRATVEDHACSFYHALWLR